MNSQLVATAQTRLGESSLSIVELTPKKARVVPAVACVEHLLVVDVSGSMANDLPKLREDMINILRSLGERDRVSVIWFSGRGQCGTLFEHQEVRTVTHFDQVKKAVERWLRLVGLTGFREPLEEATRIARSAALPISLVFMSDGCDNQWSRSELTALLKAIASDNPFQAVAVIEYGYYADRELLGQIATILGGTHIFSDGYQSYSLEVQRLLKAPQASPRQTYDLPVDVSDYVFEVDDKSRRILTYQVDGNTVSLPETTLRAFAVTRSTSKLTQCVDETALYAAAKLALVGAETPLLWRILGQLGDVRFIKRAATCFGKQANSDLAADLEAAVFSESERLTEGYDPKATPREDQVTVIDFFSVLTQADSVRLNFTYNRIGRKSEALDSDQLLARAMEEYKADGTAGAKQKLIDAVTKLDTKANFAADQVDAYAIDGIVMPEDRANLSFRVKQHGMLCLEGVPAHLKDRLPSKLPTFRYRNFAVIKDGLLNIDKLEFRFGPATWAKINSWKQAGRWPENCDKLNADGFVEIDLGLLPMSNLLNAKPVEPVWLFRKEWDLLQAQAAAKVFKASLKTFDSDDSTSLREVYGQEVADWLKTLGLSEGGFNPPTRRAESTDVYRARQLYTRIKGYSALPSMGEVRKQMEKGKLGRPAMLMEPHIKFVDDILSDSTMTEDEQRKQVRKSLDAWQFVARKTLGELANAKFAMILNGTWFKGATVDKGEFAIDLNGDGEMYDCIAEQKLIDVPI